MPIIAGNCDDRSVLFHGRKKMTTLKELSEIFWKETIDLYNKIENYITIRREVKLSRNMVIIRL